MKKIYFQLIELPTVVNQKIFNAKLNSEVENIDSQNGIRTFAKLIYQILSFVVFVVIIFGVLKSAIAYYIDPAITGLGKVGSILTTLLLIYSAFPIAQIIKSRGEKLCEEHSGMISFVFKDFVITNIKIVGEVIAVSAFISALCLTLSFIFDTNLFNTNQTILNSSNLFYMLPMDLLTSILNALKLDIVSNFIHTVSAFKINSAAESFNGDFIWNVNDLFSVCSAFINVIIGLALLYINIAIYNYVYALFSNLISWIKKPSIPINLNK